MTELALIVWLGHATNHPWVALALGVVWLAEHILSNALRMRQAQHAIATLNRATDLLQEQMENAPEKVVKLRNAPGGFVREGH